MQVSELMTEDPVTVGPDTTIREALDVMFEMDIRHLPVIDGGQLVGVISDRDIRAQTLPALTENDMPTVARALYKQPVSDLMQSDVVTVAPEDDVTDVIDMMVDHKVGAVPVVDVEDDRLVGIVSYIDVLRAARDVLE